MPKISIVSQKEGLRRGGHKFGKEPVVLDIKDLSEEQAILLEREPLLIIQEVKEEEPPKEKSKK